MAAPRTIDHDEVRRLYETGMDYRAIAEKIGAASRTVWAILFDGRHRYTPRPASESPAYVPPAYTYAEMQELAAEVGQIEAQRRMHRRRT